MQYTRHFSMNSSNLPLTLRLRVSKNGLVSVLLQPLYTALFFIAFWATLGLLVWLTNWRLLFDYILSGSNSLASKFDFFLNGYVSLVTNFTPSGATILVAFAVLSGLNTSLLAYVLSRSFKEALLNGSKNVVSITAAVIGAGCAACGTSFLAPVLIGVTGTASITLTMAIGVVANIFGLILLSYSVYKLGQTAAGLKARE